jgi:phosphoserine phosphatase RsbU/P
MGAVPGSRDTVGHVTSDRLRDIETVTDAALSRLDEQELLNVLLDRVRQVLRADTAVVLLLDRACGQLVAAAARGIEEEVQQGVRVPVGAGFAGRVAASKQPVDDIELLQLAADRAALALSSLAAQDDRLAAVALHRSLVPAALPAVPGLELAARYVTGSGNVGGDWYDVFALPDGELGIVIGDVAGAGLQAAVIMGRMRSALRAYVLETDDPGIALRKLDRKIQYFEPDAMATVLYGMYHAESGRLRVASAGHLPPVLAVPGTEPVLLDIDVGPPIGVADDAPRPTSVLLVPPGSLLCCYTDGLVERRDQSLDTGIAWLTATLGALLKPELGPGEPEHEGPPRGERTSAPLAEVACAEVMRALVGNAPARDDVAVLMLHRQPVRRG